MHGENIYSTNKLRVDDIGKASLVCFKCLVHDYWLNNDDLILYYVQEFFNFLIFLLIVI